MVWTIKWEEHALKELRKVSKPVQQSILRYFRERVATEKNPRRFGKRLTGNKSGLWRYRVGDYRVICRFEDTQCIVLVLRVAHRKKVYR